MEEHQKLQESENEKMFLDKYLKKKYVTEKPFLRVPMWLFSCTAVGPLTASRRVNEFAKYCEENRLYVSINKPQTKYELRELWISVSTPEKAIEIHRSIKKTLHFTCVFEITTHWRLKQSGHYFKRRNTKQISEILWATRPS